MEDDSFDFLRELVETPSPSGYETENIVRWRERVEGHADRIETDDYGNTTATLNPESEASVVVTGHVDEIGLMVNHVTDDGYVYVKKVGGIDAGVAQGQRVVIHGREGEVTGVVGRKPIHLQEEDERKEVPEIDEVYIDIGASDADEVEDAGVHVGAPVTYDVGFESLQGNVVAGRGLDNRIGTWTAAEVFRAVDPEDVDVTFHSLVTVQEELGLRGAQMASYSLDPDVALVVDVTFATDAPGLESTKHGVVELGEGPTLKHGKENHPEVLERLRRVSDDRGIPLQDEAIMSRGATDADAFYTSRGGIPTVSVGVPNRNMHTTAEVVDTRDLERVRDLFAGFVTSLESDPDFSRL